MSILAACVSGSVRFCYIVSAPLIDDVGAGNCNPVDNLDFDYEREVILKVLKECNKAIDIRVTTATQKTFSAEMVRGCCVLHYSGHGKNDSLAFEDEKGQLKNFTVEMLKGLLGALDKTKHGDTTSGMVRE